MLARLRIAPPGRLGVHVMRDGTAADTAFTLWEAVTEIRRVARAAAGA